jgi:hypothetical protein
MRSLMPGIRAALGAIGGAVLCGMPIYWFLQEREPGLLPARLSAMPLITGIVGAITGGTLAVLGRRWLGGFFRGAFLGAIILPGTVAILAIRSHNPIIGEHVMYVWWPVCAIGSPLYAVVGSAFGAARACAPSRWLGALHLGGILGAVLPLATVRAVDFPALGGVGPWFDIWLGTLLIASPVAALIAGAFGVYVVRAQLRRAKAFLLGGILGAVLPLLTRWATEFLMAGAWPGWREPEFRKFLIVWPVGAWVGGAFGAYIAGRSPCDEDSASLAAGGGWTSRLWVAALAWTALALFTVSLFLPVVYDGTRFFGVTLGQAIHAADYSGRAKPFGVMRGWTIPAACAEFALYSAFFGSFDGLLYASGGGLLCVFLPASVLAGYRGSYTRAALLAGLALVPPAYLLATEGLYLYPARSTQQIFASGLVCWFASALLMTLAWALALLRSRTRRG